MAKFDMNSMLGMTPEEMEIARKQRYAERLRYQADEPMHGQVVNGMYIPPSWTQGLAKMLSSYSAGRTEREAGEEYKNLQNQRQTDFMDTAQKYAAALRGTDTQYSVSGKPMPSAEAAQAASAATDNVSGFNLEQSPVAPNVGMYSGDAAIPPAPQNLTSIPSYAPVTTIPGKPGSREAALAIALQSNHPMWQQAGMQGMLETPDAVEYSTTPQYDQEGRAFVLGKGGQIKYLDGVQARDKTEFVNGVAVNPYQVKPGTMLPDYNKPFLPDGSPNPAYQTYEVGKARAGATNVVNNISQSTEKKYGEQFAGKVAEADVSLMDAAQKAPELAARADRIKQVLESGKVITGAGADYRLAFAKAAGLVGASDSETIANTETLASDLSKNTLDAIKASGLGSGNGFSNADRDFLEKAAGGKITFDSKTLGRLADLSHRTAQLTAERWNKRAKTIPASAIQGTGISTDPINIPTTAPTARGAKFLGYE